MTQPYQCSPDHSPIVYFESDKQIAYRGDMTPAEGEIKLAELKRAYPEENWKMIIEERKSDT